MTAHHPSPQPFCLLSFDVDESFQVEAARPRVSRRTWESGAGRLDAGIDWLLERLAEAGATATFFTLGRVARRSPSVVRRIAEAGHEIACHGDQHDHLHCLDTRRLRDGLRAARAALRDAADCTVNGYRAPTFSLTRETGWAVDVLIEEGFTFDSSVQPVRCAPYGQRSAPRYPYRLVGESGRWIAEIPPLTWQAGPMRWAAADGGFRALPLMMMKRGIAQAARAGQPAMLCFHPWAFDADQPHLMPGRAARLRARIGLHRSRRRFRRLLRNIGGISIGRWLAGRDPFDWPIHTLEETLNLTEIQQPETVPMALAPAPEAEPRRRTAARSAQSTQGGGASQRRVA